MRDGLLVYNRQGSLRDIQIDILGLLDFNKLYKVSFEYIELQSD